ncbi:hypothetical protein M011DRAFT_372674, partial [Sporormia fimetaria CBS 119925]
FSTFHPFPRLPCELRLQIWEHAVEPRTIEVRYRAYKPERLLCTNPVPAIMEACREARDVGLKLYEKAFLDSIPGRPDLGERYIWLNWDFDVISIGRTRLEKFLPVKTLIQRLKLERNRNDGFWDDSADYTLGREDENPELRSFINVREIYIVMDSFDMMYGLRSTVETWPCGADNVVFIDGASGE